MGTNFTQYAAFIDACGSGIFPEDMSNGYIESACQKDEWAWIWPQYESTYFAKFLLDCLALSNVITAEKLGTMTRHLTYEEDDRQEPKIGDHFNGFLSLYNDNYTLSGSLLRYETWSSATTLQGNVYVPENVTLTLCSNLNLNLSTYAIISTGGTIFIQEGVTFTNPYVSRKTGGTFNGLYSSIVSALSEASNGQTVKIYGTHTLTSNLTVTSGVVLDGGSNATINLGLYSIKSTGGTIACDYTILNPDICLKTGSTVKGLYSSIASAVADAISNDCIYLETSSITLDGNVAVPLGITLMIKNSATVNLGPFGITSTGGIITVESQEHLNPNIRIVSGSTLKGLYGNIALAAANAISGETITPKARYYPPYTETNNVVLASGVSLILASDTRILFSGATLTIGSGASISPYIRIEEGSTLKGLYSSISLASTNVASGQRIVPAAGTYTYLPAITIGSGVCLYLSSGTQLTFTDQLLIRGTLQASGVTFTKYNGYPSWYGIYMESSSSSSYLNNCTIQYGIYGLYIDNCSPTISGTDINCHIAQHRLQFLILRSVA